MRGVGLCRTRQSRRSARGTTTVTWRRCRRGTAATTRRSQSYATQGSNPRRAGRVPGRSAAHTVGPRLGQASLDWPALKTTLVLAPRPAAAPLCDANGRQCVQVLAVLWLYLPWSLPPWTSPCRCSTYYGYTSYGCAVCVQVVAYDTENSDMYPPGQGSMVKVTPWQCPSSAPVPPQGASGGSGQLGTPKKRACASSGRAWRLWAARHS